LSGIFADSKYHNSDFDQLAFLDAQKLQNEYAWLFNTLKHLFIDITKVVFNVQKAEYEYSRPLEYLKPHFRYFVQVAFLDAQEKNVFQWAFETLKYCFIEIS
jgi:hypothetical protein